MSLAEAARLTRIIRDDPSSQLAAAIEGWAYPFSREQAAAADLWDLEYAKTGPKNKVRYPRPFPQPDEQVRHGNAAGRTPDEVKAILREHFGQPEAPV